MSKRTTDDAARFKSGQAGDGTQALFWAQPFNRRMIVTYGLETALRIRDFAPAVENAAAGVKFWLVRLGGADYGWAASSDAEPEKTLVFSKSPLPERLSSGSRFRLEVLQRMSDARIRAWASRVHFFQGFSWLPAGTHAANSALVWGAVAARCSFGGKTVLDIGTNFGYYAFRASRAGALVFGQDRNANVLKVAELINDRIEMQDVGFGTAYDEGDRYDIVLYLSVHHQVDPEYKELGRRMDKLRAMARQRVFVELIVPPLRGRMTAEDVDRTVGGAKLLTYRHKVRRVRALYDVSGGG